MHKHNKMHKQSMSKCIRYRTRPCVRHVFVTCSPHVRWYMIKGAFKHHFETFPDLQNIRLKNKKRLGTFPETQNIKNASV